MARGEHDSEGIGLLAGRSQDATTSTGKDDPTVSPSAAVIAPESIGADSVRVAPAWWISASALRSSVQTTYG